MSDISIKEKIRGVETLRASLSVECKISANGYNLLLDEPNRLAALQQRIQKLFNELEILGDEPVLVDAIRFAHLSMSHKWKNVD